MNLPRNLKWCEIICSKRWPVAVTDVGWSTLWCKGAPYNSICTRKQQGVTRQPRDSLRLLPVDDRHKVKGPRENSIPIVLQQCIESRSAFIPINTTSACAWKWSDWWRTHSMWQKKTHLPNHLRKGCINSQEGNGLMNGLILQCLRRPLIRWLGGVQKAGGGRIFRWQTEPCGQFRHLEVIQYTQPSNGMLGNSLRFIRAKYMLQWLCDIQENFYARVSPELKVWLTKHTENTENSGKIYSLNLGIWVKSIYFIFDQISMK